MSASAIEVDDLGVALDGVQVVEHVTFEVREGEWVALIGPNGAGKTTLIRAVAGLVPYTGAVRLGGLDASAMGRRDRARQLALVPQEASTPSWMSVADYVLLGRTPHLRLLEHEGVRDHEAARSALQRLDLLPLAGRRLGTLSGGEKQRAVVARALAQDAKTVLLDEPTSALDIGHQQQALELLDRLRDEAGLTLVAAMHDLTLAAQYACRVILIDRGRVVADGAPADVLTEPLLARHYDADVRVIEVDGRVAVIPARTAALRSSS